MVFKRKIRKKREKNLKVGSLLAFTHLKLKKKTNFVQVQKICCQPKMETKCGGNVIKQNDSQQ